MSQQCIHSEECASGAQAAYAHGGASTYEEDIHVHLAEAHATRLCNGVALSGQKITEASKKEAHMDDLSKMHPAEMFFSHLPS